MDTKILDNLLGAALFGKSRRAVLGLLYSHPDQAFYLRQIARFSGTGIGAVQRELKRLAESGIISREAVGNQVHFQANKACPIFRELRSLIIKTAGVSDIVKTALSPLAERICVAFIFGSMASGEPHSQSDVDLLIVGDVSLQETVTVLAPTQKSLGREVNPVIYSLIEFKEKLGNGHHFVTSVVKDDKIFLIGSEDELEAVGE